MATRVPTIDSEFDQYIRNTTTVLETGTPAGADRLGLTAGQGTQWIANRDQWIDVYPKYTNKAIRTASITATKNAIKKSFAVFAETPLKRIEISENLTADDRAVFNLKERDKTPTRKGAIADRPFGKITGTGGGMLEVRVRRENDATRSSMHELADAVEFRYFIGDEKNNPQPPQPQPSDKIPTPEDCPNSVTSKVALWRVNAGTANLGKRIVGFLRWVNLSNPANNSGWSDLMTTIIS